MEMSGVVFELQSRAPPTERRSTTGSVITTLVKLEQTMLASAPAFASVNNPQQCGRACGNCSHPLLGPRRGRTTRLLLH